MVITIVGGVAVAIFLGKSKAGAAANAEQEKAINAMQKRLDAQAQDIADLRMENTRLEQTIDTICKALKVKKGLVVTIQGEMVSIEDRNGNMTTTRIHQKEAM